MNYQQTKRPSVVLTSVLVLAALAWILVNASSVVSSFIDASFTSAFTSAKGEFSIDLPRRWRISRNPTRDRPKDYFSESGETCLYAEFSAYRRRWYASSTRRKPNYASVSVVRMTLADSVELPYPSAAELGDQLVARIQGRKDQLDIIGVFLKLQPLPPDTIGSARSEVRSFRAYRWAKTTRSYIDIFGWDGGVVCYQLIIDKTHYYVVTFSTNCLPDYDSVFEKIMASFKYQPGEYRP